MNGLPSEGAASMFGAVISFSSVDMRKNELFDGALGCAGGRRYLGDVVGWCRFRFHVSYAVALCSVVRYAAMVGTPFPCASIGLRVVVDFGVTGIFCGEVRVVPGVSGWPVEWGRFRRIQLHCAVLLWIWRRM